MSLISALLKFIQKKKNDLGIMSKKHKGCTIYVKHCIISIYVVHNIWSLLYLLRKLDTSHKAAFVVAVSEFFIIILRINVVLVFGYTLIDKAIREMRAKKWGIHFYLSPNIWIDIFPGSRNGETFFFSLYTFYQSFLFGFSFFSKFYEEKIFLDLKLSVVSIVPIRKNFLMLLLAILLILISIRSGLSFYWDVGSGLNMFDKKRDILYMTRYGWPGRCRFRVWEIPIKEISCIILKKDKYLGDVLYVQTKQENNFLLTPINVTRYNLREKAGQLSRFLNVPLKII